MRKIWANPVDLRVKFGPLWDFIVVDDYKLVPQLFKRERDRSIMLYLVRLPGLIPKILEVAKRDNAVFMFVCGLEEFSGDPARAPFKNAWGDTMRLGEAKFQKAGRAWG